MIKNTLNWSPHYKEQRKLLKNFAHWSLTAIINNVCLLKTPGGSGKEKPVLTWLQHEICLVEGNTFIATRLHDSQARWLLCGAGSELVCATEFWCDPAGVQHGDVEGYCEHLVLDVRARWLTEVCFSQPGGP